jgi:hypothetical protein
MQVKVRMAGLRRSSEPEGFEPAESSFAVVLATYDDVGKYVRAND